MLSFQCLCNIQVEISRRKVIDWEFRRINSLGSLD